MTKPKVSRTLGPIHFEDLDPHRFEDLIRQLAYDFRQWQSIESTGRGGSDDGFDVRAFEALPILETFRGDEDEAEDTSHPMEGNLWMIQCKREKALGPKRVGAIIDNGVDPNAPPYGYILAAPANFSKAAHDRFREELRKRGVMEFYLWGAGELEDMLYQPKSDHILFAFFGISLASRRRTRTTEIRATVSAKNKLIRILGDHPSHKSVLLRDIKDTNYPFEDKYRDFAKHPRWTEYVAVDFHPLGLVASVNRYYAYIDRTKREFDFTRTVDVVRFRNARRHRDDDSEEQEFAVKSFWEQLPHAKKAMFIRNGLIRFDTIAFIDDKGDRAYDCPHLFVDFHSERGPIAGFLEYLEINLHHTESLDGFKRAEIFPETFPQPTFGTVHEDKTIILDGRTFATARHGSDRTILYCADNRYAYLEPTDVIDVQNAGGDKAFLKITNVRVAEGKELLDLSKDNPPLKQEIEIQIGRDLKRGDRIRVIEALPIYDWQIDQNRPVV